MARFTKILLTVLFVLAVVVEGKKKKNPNKKFPPCTNTVLSDQEIDRTPKFKPSVRHRGVTLIPVAFDARVQWPKCDSIKLIRDQGMCGTCWAVSGASVLSDRICIASGQKINVQVSANQAASCSVATQTPTQNCNAGGDAANVYKFASLYGLPTGGEFNSKVGCVPYQVGNSAVPLTCSTKCTNPLYTTTIASDNRMIDSYWITYQKQNTVMNQTTIDTVVNQMQTEIMTNGPITVSIQVYNDFQTWDADDGVYKGPGAGAQKIGGHAVKLIGWNKDKTGTPYWIISNSWGMDAGEEGLYWVQMGKNVIGIESSISAPTVSLPNTCTGASFCNKPIDSVILSNVKDSKSPAYLFQGACIQQVSITTAGKLTAVGSAVPISKVFLGAPAPPITGSFLQSNLPWLINSANQAGSNCQQPTGASKFTCGGGSISGSTPGAASTNFYSGSTLTTWSYYPNNQNWLFDTNGNGKSIGTLITSKFTGITGMLNLDGSKMAVFGKDAAGKPLAGVMAYPTAAAAGASWIIQPGPPSGVLTCAA